MEEDVLDLKNVMNKRFQHIETSVEGLKAELHNLMAALNKMNQVILEKVREVTIGDPRKEIAFVGLVIVGMFAALYG